ncbi:MFS transporter [Streptomyces sp. NPDC001978]|uniref:MFS transporter n=1 Tax=Streptomyces sp. NPDC001978 TaxID=3364627 RepID=UPI00369FD542
MNRTTNSEANDQASAVSPVNSDQAISAHSTLSHASQGLVISAFFVAYAVSQIPGGLLADRFGARLVHAAATRLRTARSPSMPGWSAD